MKRHILSLSLSYQKDIFLRGYLNTFRSDKKNILTVSITPSTKLGLIIHSTLQKICYIPIQSYSCAGRKIKYEHFRLFHNNSLHLGEKNIRFH